MARWPRFSLRSMLLFVVVVTAALGLLVPLQKRARLQRTRQSLSMVGLAYHHCVSSTGSPPAKLQDLKVCPCAGPDAIAAIQGEGFVIFWNVNVRTTNGKYVLGYEKDVPKWGGLVLMADGVVKPMTAGEFSTAPMGKTVSVVPPSEE